MNRHLARLLVLAVLAAGCATRLEPSIVASPAGPTESASAVASVSPTAIPSSPPSATAAVTPSDVASATPAASPSATIAASAVPRVLPQGGEPVTLDPADFVAVIDNRYWPMTPGTQWTYRETDGEGGVFKVVVTVTNETKQILGITATVVHDLVTEDGETVEDTLDWYAQDRDGNTWYLGEDTKEYDGGEVVSTAGSWEAGVDGAFAGVVLPSAPEPGLTYRQEYFAGEAEDAATVLSLTEWVEVPTGSYDSVLMTKEFTPLEPDILEYKFYAPGVGPVLALTVSGGSDREELTEFVPAQP